MKKTIAVLLCAAVCLSLAACGMRQSAPEESAAPVQTSAPAAPAPTPAPTGETAEAPQSEPTAETAEAPQPEPEAEAAEAFDQAAYDAAAEEILGQFRQLRESGLDNFDEDAHPQLPWYTAVVASFPVSGLYYGYYDFDGNGVKELIVAAGDGAYFQPIGIYAFDGAQMRYLCSQQALGERASLSYGDGLFCIRGSGGAADGAYTLYRIAPDGYSADVLEIVEYHYYDESTVEYTPTLGKMTAEEFRAMDLPLDFDVPVTYELLVPAQ